MSTSNRVVVTGIGLISPLGIGNDENWTNLISGKTGFSKVSRFDVTKCPCQIAGEVKGFEEHSLYDAKEARRYDLFIQYGLAAAKLAFSDAKLTREQIVPERSACIAGSGIGGFLFMGANQRKIIETDSFKVSPFFIPGAIINMLSGAISMEYNLKGANFGVVSACASGGHAITEAYSLIQRGDADIVFAGGSEACINDLSFAGFTSMKAMTTHHNDNPSAASRPFDKTRSGFVMGEGAGIVVLERLDKALERNAPIYAELVGYGYSADASHITAPDENGEGAYQAMKMAIEKAGIKPSDVDYINAHGTSTPINDRIETLAIKRVFGEDGAKKVSISSTKSMTGHLLGAAGAIEAIFSILAIKNGKIPPTMNYSEPDPDCDLNYTPNKSVDRVVNYALSNSFGFGGTNSCLLFKKYNA